MSRQVLIADDYEDLRLFLSLLLTRDGEFRVVAEAGNGRDAVERARSLQPDVVLLDLHMPVMSGLAALPQVREAVPNATIVVFSGLEGARVADETRRLGADAYVEKGASPKEIVDTLRAAMSSKPETS